MSTRNTIVVGFVGGFVIKGYSSKHCVRRFHVQHPPCSILRRRSIGWVSTPAQYFDSRCFLTACTHLAMVGEARLMESVM